MRRIQRLLHITQGLHRAHQVYAQLGGQRIAQNQRRLQSSLA
jgi:hypothetical protein